jgi:hypothetical protein
MSTDGPRIERAREQLARRDANAEDAPEPSAPPREEIDEQARAVRDERSRDDDA